MKPTSLRQLTLIWLVWAVVLISFMAFASARFAPSRPDDALVWTANETSRRSLEGKIYLLEPFLNWLVAWDSEYYLSIATVGYDDPALGTFTASDGQAYSRASAFFPGYPFVIRGLALPLGLAGLTPIAAATAAGVLISLLGTLAGMVALYDLARQHGGEEGGIRTAWAMLIFPSSLFFAVVYTEGLFVGLAFGSLALLRRRQWLLAAALAAFATWTRAIGGVLVVPLLLTWAYDTWRAPQRTAMLPYLPLSLLPVAAYALWRLAYGHPFEVVEAEYFGNGLLNLGKTLDAWGQILQRASEVPETATIVIMNLGAAALAFASCVVCARRYPTLALFGALALLVPFTGGWTSTQSTLRYVLVVPTLWIMLGSLCRSVVFHYGWSLLGILLLGMNAFLFSFDFWVA